MKHIIALIFIMLFSIEGAYAQITTTTIKDAFKKGEWETLTLVSDAKIADLNFLHYKLHAYHALGQYNVTLTNYTPAQLSKEPYCMMKWFEALWHTKQYSKLLMFDTSKISPRTTPDLHFYNIWVYRVAAALELENEEIIRDDTYINTLPSLDVEEDIHFAHTQQRAKKAIKLILSIKNPPIDNLYGLRNKIGFMPDLFYEYLFNNDLGNIDYLVSWIEDQPEQTVTGTYRIPYIKYLNWGERTLEEKSKIVSTVTEVALGSTHPDVNDAHFILLQKMKHQE